MWIWNIIWLIFILYTFMPLLKQRNIEIKRYKMIQDIEKKRGTRVIVMIHRQEMLSILGLPLSRYINIEDSEQVLRAIRFTPDDMPIDLILHTPGGLVLAAEQIAHAIMKHRGKVTVMVPHYAMSGGTLLALAADEIMMDENAVLGPVDPQLGNYPAVSLKRVLKEKPIEKIDDETLIMADMAEKAIVQVRDSLFRILSKRFDEDKSRELADIFTQGRWTHDYPISCEQLRSMGLQVSNDLPEEVYRLMELYPQPVQRRPSVQYVPLPYRKRRDE